MVGNKRGVKTQANTTVRCPRTSPAPHPHTFGNTKFGAKLRCHSRRFRTLEIIDTAKVKLCVIRKEGAGWVWVEVEVELRFDRWLILSL